MNKDLKGFKKYFTRLNFTKPYLVYIGKSKRSIKKEVCVFAKDKNYINDELDKAYMYTKLIKCFNPEKIFIGKSTASKYTKKQKTDNSKYDGNSFLLKMDKTNYIFIGDRILKFKVKDDEIIKFYSPLLKNDTPLPFAIGKKNIYSFIHPEGYLEKEKFTNLKIDTLLVELLKYEPYLLSFKNHKPNSKLTAKKGKKLLQKKKSDITLIELKEIAKAYKITTSGSKTQIFQRLDKLRNIQFKS